MQEFEFMSRELLLRKLEELARDSIELAENYPLGALLLLLSHILEHKKISEEKLLSAFMEKAKELLKVKDPDIDIMQIITTKSILPE